MTTQQKDEIYEMLKTMSIPQVMKITGRKVTAINKVLLDRIHRKALTGTVDLSDVKVQYYESEADILQELEASYRAEDLKGEELEIFKKMI
jgi:hypothetical protein